MTDAEMVEAALTTHRDQGPHCCGYHRAEREALVLEVARLRPLLEREAVGREAAEQAADALKHVIEAG